MHHTDVYQNFFSLHYHWEGDDTNAEQDEKTFHELASLLGFPTPESYVIPRNNIYPALSLQVTMCDMLSKAIHSKGHSVLLFHYSGKGYLNELGQLMLLSAFRKKINAARLLSDVVERDSLPVDYPLDVVFIFDCGTGFVATGKRHLGGRLVDVLSGGDSGLSKRRTLLGDQSVEMAELIEDLKGPSPYNTPSYAGMFGTGSVVLPLSQPGLDLVRWQKQPELMTTFSVHICRGIDGWGA